jgi:hypothetical protein
VDLFTAHTLLVEHPGGFRRALWRTTYDVSVYDEHDRLLATVVERSGPGAAALVRATGWSGHTSFDLRVVSSDGHKVAVTGGTGTALGSLTRHGRSDVALTDAVGTPLGTLGGVGSLRTGALAKRDGHRVRRDVLTLRPDLGSPTRALAIAAALAWDIVHGRGTTRPSGSAWPAG